MKQPMPAGLLRNANGIVRKLIRAYNN